MQKQHAIKPKRLTRQESKDLTRERLLEAAHTLFLEQGYAGATIEDITAAAGFTRGAFYSNFNGKPQILLELLLRSYASMMSEAHEIAASGSDVDQMRSALLAYYGKLLDQREYFLLCAEARLLSMRDADFRQRFNEVLENEHGQIVQLMDAFRAHPGIRTRMPSNVLAIGFAAMLQGVQAFTTSTPDFLSTPLAQATLSGFMDQILFDRQ
jgi:AcrR family transcriptional regulator